MEAESSIAAASGVSPILIGSPKKTKNGKNNKAEVPNGNRRTIQPPPNRAARLYWSHNELPDNYVLSSPRALSQNTGTGSSSQWMGNPLVLGTITAGVLGVLLIAILIIGVWIRSRVIKDRRSSQEVIDVESTDVNSSSSSSSMSNSNSVPNVTQLDSIKLDDTTFYSANECPSSLITIENASTPKYEDSPRIYYWKSLNAEIKEELSTIIWADSNSESDSSLETTEPPSQQ